MLCLHTLREGLLRATPATSDTTRSVSASGVVVRSSRPFSLFRPATGVSSSSCRMGLEGSIASLLGTGVRDGGGRVKDFFEKVDVGVCFAGVGCDGAGLGELVDFFWKKPRMDFWFFADCDPEVGCFFCEGRGVDISLPSTPRTMLAVLVQQKCGEASGAEVRTFLGNASRPGRAFPVGRLATLLVSARHTSSSTFSAITVYLLSYGTLSRPTGRREHWKDLSSAKLEAVTANKLSSFLF